MKDDSSYIILWESTPVRIIDVQHGGFKPTDNKSFQTIGNAFLFVVAKKGMVTAGDTPYSFERYQMLHVQRKTEIVISSSAHWAEYYIVYYQNGSPLLSRAELLRLTEEGDPFESQYALTPSNPVLAGELFKHMYEAWNLQAPVQRLAVKADFFKLVSEVYSDSICKPELLSAPDKYEQIKMHLDKHYGEAVSIKSLLNTLDISSAHINRIFNQRTGCSPQQYLINTRLNAAQRLLANKNISINEIATACGFSDSAYFCRLFKNGKGVTPSEYREMNPVPRGDLLIDEVRELLYNDKLVRLFKLILEGETLMYKKLKNYGLLAMALCLALVLAACQSPASGTPANTDPTSTPAAAQAPTPDAQSEERGITISNFNRITTYTKIPERVISLSYSETEILIALGLGDKIVGIATADSSLGDCLPEYQDEIGKLNVIAGGVNAAGVPTLEVLLSSEPDFVYGTAYSFSSSSGVGDPEDFDKNNINFYAGRTTYINGGTMEDVYEDILNIGRIFDVDERAAELVEKMKSSVKEVTDKTSGIEKPLNVFVYDSGTEKAYTPGMSLETDMIRLAGGKNVFGDISKQFAAVGWESVVEANPDVIVVHKWDDTDDPQAKIEFLKSLPELASVPAIANNRFVILKFNLAFPCVQNADAVAYLAESFYPDLFN